MKISAIHVYSIELPVANGPYTYSGGSLYSVSSTVVELVTNCGLTGFGECCPVGPTYAAEHARGAVAALCELAPPLIAENPLAINTIHNCMEKHLNGHNYAKAAVDIALWDLAGKHYGARVCDLLGGAQTEEVPSYYTTGSVTPDEAARIAAEKLNQGFERLQIKVGGREIAEDIETIIKVYEVTGNNMRLAADANRSWTTRDTLFASNALRHVPVVFEQPCNSLAEIITLRKSINHPIYIDESSVDVQTVVNAAGNGWCDGFGFKLTRFAGISGLRQVRDICNACNLPHTCDDAWGSDIIAAACLHVGSTVAPHLNEGVWIAQPYIEGHYDSVNGIKVDQGKIRLPTGPGLGITPERNKLGSPIASYG